MASSWTEEPRSADDPETVDAAVGQVVAWLRRRPAGHRDLTPRSAAHGHGANLPAGGKVRGGVRV